MATAFPVAVDYRKCSLAHFPFTYIILCEAEVYLPKKERKRLHHRQTYVEQEMEEFIKPG